MTCGRGVWVEARLPGLAPVCAEPGRPIRWSVGVRVGAQDFHEITVFAQM
jgi:hypothetical protein